MSELNKTLDWFIEAYRGRQSSDYMKHTQMGVHFEEVAEMVRSLVGSDIPTNRLLVNAHNALEALSAHLKQNDSVVTIRDRVEFLDALCDQIVTAVGCAYHEKMAIVGAFAEVNRSNFSKFDENGKAVLDQNQKVAKSSHYRRAELQPFV